MRILSFITLLAALILPPVAVAEVQTFTATHTYILGDHDSKDDARQRCLLETKRKILERAGVYIESASEVKDLQLTKDKITSFAAAVMQVKDTKEEVSFQQGHMTMTVTTTAQVDLEEVRKQLAARQLDAGVRDDVVAQKERLKRLEAQLEAMQRQQGGQSSGQLPASPPIDFVVDPPPIISAEDLQTLQTQAAQGIAEAENRLGRLYYFGQGVPQDYAKAREWYEKAAAQGYAAAQANLGTLYYRGQGVPQDYVKAREWYEKAAAQGNALAQNNLGVLYAEGQGVPQDYAQASQWYEQAASQGDDSAQFNLAKLYALGQGVPRDYAQASQWLKKAAAQGNVAAQSNLGMLYGDGQGVPQDNVKAYMWWNLAAAHSTGDKLKRAGNNRDKIARRMTPSQIAEAQRLAQQCQTQQFKGC